MTRPSFLATTAAAALLALSGAAAADFPTRQINVIVPYAPGATDTLARTLVAEMVDDLGVTVAVESRPGAGGTVGARAVAAAAPDGYTILIAFSSVHTLGPHQNPDLDYGFDDLAPVARIALGPNVLGASASAPFETLEGLIDYARENPGAVSFGTAGTGGLSHLHGEAFARAAGIELFHIPFQGVTPAVAAAVAGDVDLVIGLGSSIMPQDAAGAMRAIAQFGDTRAGILPDLPTFPEVGVDVSLPTLIGMWAPAGTPDDVIARLGASLEQAIASDAVQEYGRSVLIEFSFADSATFGEQLATENEMNVGTLRALGMID